MKADAAYKEAVSILKEIQSCAKMYHLDATTMDTSGAISTDATTTDAITMYGKDDEKEKITLDCTKYLKTNYERMWQCSLSSWEDITLPTHVWSSLWMLQ